MSPYAVRVLPTTIASLLASLQQEPGRPRITWYGGDGERVELSGAVLDNWVTKTTNLLVEELDAGPGTVVLLDLPGHWRTVVWALSVWRAGACVALPGASTDAPDVVVTHDPATHADARALVAVPLPALARRFDGALPGGAVDAGSAVMTYGDVLGWAPATDPSAAALVAPELAVPHARLVETLTDRPGSARARTLVVASDTVALDDLAAVLAVLARDGSAVLVDRALAGELEQDRPRLDRLLSAEQVTGSALG
ncbi:MAG: TIGR03089 family protein [Cellulomonas sp.]|nr:TIGR03089 family protein [Cellulomonas sp.]